MNSLACQHKDSLCSCGMKKFGMFLGDFSCFPTGPKVVPKTAKLVPDWIPTGQKRCQKMQMTGSHLCPYFPLLRTSRAPIPPASCTQTAKAVLSQTRGFYKLYYTKYNYIALHSTPLHLITPQLHFATLHYTTLNCTTLHSTPTTTTTTTNTSTTAQGGGGSFRRGNL